MAGNQIADESFTNERFDNYDMVIRLYIFNMLQPRVTNRKLKSLLLASMISTLQLQPN